MERISGIVEGSGAMLLQELQRVAMKMAIFDPGTHLDRMVIGDSLESDFFKSRKVHDQYRSELREPSRDARLE